MPASPDYISEPAKQVPVKDEVDVLVVGGGPAGAAAAISAAQQGARTLLLEQFGTIGGMATTGLMSHWGGRALGGFFEEFMDRSIEPFVGGIIKPENAGDWLAINTEKQKTVFLEMLAEAGAKLQLYSLACSPIMDGQKITGVIAESKSGREAFLARVVIDATGDGDIAARAGVPFTKGRESDGKMQPVTLMFRVAGVDISRGVFPGGFEQTFPVPKGDLQTLGKTNLPPPAGHVLLYRSPLPGVVTVNMTNCIDVDGTRAEDLTRAEMVCRNQIDPIVRFLSGFVPGFEHCYVISSGAVMGVRETRHFEGEYTLTPEDILQARVFEDWAVAKVHFNFDVHNLAGSGLDATGVQKKFSQQNPYTIPYRCFVPKKVDNLLLAGRNISGTHLAHSSFRIMSICANGGQAMGIAAALCVKQNTSPRQLNVKHLQDILKTQGVTP